MEFSNITLGTNLKLLRLKKGVSRKEAAAVFGVNPATLANYENGRGGLDLGTAYKIADYYGVEVSALADPGFSISLP